MPNTMTPHMHTISTEPSMPGVPFHPALVPTPRKPKPDSLDSLLKGIPTQQGARHTAPDADLDLIDDAGPGVFMGLRVALFFNAGLGIAAFVAYEAWMMLAR